ncbi:MAG TPA: hypothetical protein VGZ47_12125, partial [Gemmataceae bacterium]|nr:hypothetical protein [Gemmataceae bacterium]
DSGKLERLAVLPHPEAPLPSPVAAEPAADIHDLARLLAQRTESIVLTGKIYNLSELGANPLLLWKGRHVTIEGKQEGNSDWPIIYWDAPPYSFKESPSYVSAFHLSGNDGDVTFKHIRFDVQPNESDVPQYAVAAEGLQGLHFVDCQFRHEGMRGRGGLIRFEGQTSAEPPVVSLEHCFLAHGPVGVELQDRSLLRARQCAFGPHEILFHWKENAVPATPNPDRLLADLSHCSVMMHNGSIFQPDGAVAGTIRAAQCLFANGNERGEAGEVVLVQQSEPRGKVIFAGSEASDGWRNVYHHVTLWADSKQKARRLADCQHLQFPFHDAHGVELAFSPWQHAQPLSLLPDQPQEAFALQTGFLSLRVGHKHDQLVGVPRSIWGRIYEAPLPVLQEEPATAAANRRVVDPAFPPDGMLPPLTYRTLENAINEAKTGDTILIRHTGTLTVRPVECSKSDRRLTIQPDGSHRPILELDRETAKPQAALFTLFSGSLTFKDLQFRLPLSALRESKWAGVVQLTASGECSFQHCTITMEDNTNIPSAVVLLSADADAMSQLADKNPPHIRFDNCFVRGRGDVLTVRPSRPFQMELNNSLIGLDGSFATVFGQGKEAAFPTDGQIVCQHVTTYLNDYWLDFRANEEDRKMAGFSGLRIKCENCRFVAANNRPLVHGVGIDVDTLWNQNQVLKWEPGSNLYGNFAQMLDVELPGNSMMPMMPLTPKAWRSRTSESEDSFVDMQIAHKPGADRPWSRMRAEDFAAKRVDMKKIDIKLNEYGANASELPAPDDEPLPTSNREE